MLERVSELGLHVRAGVAGDGGPLWLWTAILYINSSLPPSLG